MWDRQEIDAGIIKENSTLAVSFRYYGAAPDMTFRASCGCTSVTWNPVTGMVSATVNVSNIPKHLKNQGQFALFKTITATYTVNGETKNDLLIIKGIVK